MVGRVVGGDGDGGKGWVVVAGEARFGGGWVGGWVVGEMGDGGKMAGVTVSLGG